MQQTNKKTRQKKTKKQKTKIKTSKIKQSKKVPRAYSSIIPQYVRFFVVVLGGVVFRFPNNLEKKSKQVL